MHFATVAALLSMTMASSNPPSCGDGQDPCPSEYPCCSASGTCGNGYVCLGGCDPRYSNTPGSCVAMPVFPSTDQNFNGTESIATYADYLGDADKQPYSYLGNITTGDNNALRIQMYQGTGGSTVSTSHYVWYGKVTLKMKTSGGGGVVSDFILLSNVKDEIDYEMVGYDLNNVQTNYYWQGTDVWTNMVKAGVSSDTEQNFHEYSIDWQENTITWSIDGNTVRTLNKEDTKNATTGEYKYPQTPCRVQFGLWPGGDSSSQGTQEWAGGQINWSAGQGANPGYFFVDVESITVQPYDPPSGTNTTGSKSYVYLNRNANEGDVALTDEDFILGATDGTGNQLAGPYGHSSSASASSSTASSSSSASSSASSSSASSSSVSSSSASSSSASSSSASSSSASSSSVPSSSLASSSSASSSSASSSAAPSSSATSSSQPSSSGAVGAAAGAGGSSAVSSSGAGASSSTASSSSSSSSTSAASSSAKSTAVSNEGITLVAPMLAAILPAAFIL